MRTRTSGEKGPCQLTQKTALHSSTNWNDAAGRYKQFVEQKSVEPLYEDNASTKLNAVFTYKYRHRDP